MRNGEAGFSLLEALVAVAILSGGMIATLQLQSANARRETAVISRTQALLTAEALMAELSAGFHALPVSTAGETEFGVRWRMDVFQMDRETTDNGTSHIFNAKVFATPADGGRPVALSTLLYRPAIR